MTKLGRKSVATQVLIQYTAKGNNHLKALMHELITLRNTLLRTSAGRTIGYLLGDEADDFIEGLVCFN